MRLLQLKKQVLKVLYLVVQANQVRINLPWDDRYCITGNLTKHERKYKKVRKVSNG